MKRFVVAAIAVFVIGLVAMPEVAQTAPYHVVYDFEGSWSGDYAPGWANMDYRHGATYGTPVATMTQVGTAKFGSYGVQVTAVSAAPNQWFSMVMVKLENVNAGAMQKRFDPYVSVWYYDQGYSSANDPAGQLTAVPSWVNRYIPPGEDWTDIQFGARFAVEDNYYYVAAGQSSPGWQNTNVARPTNTPTWTNFKMQLSSADGKVHFYVNGSKVGSSYRSDYVDLGQEMGLYTMFMYPLSAWNPKPSTIWDHFEFGSSAQAAGGGLIESGVCTVQITSDPAGSAGKGTAGMLTGGGRAVPLAETITLNQNDVVAAMTALNQPYLTLKMYYSEEELAQLGIAESTVRPYWYNESTKEWILGGTTIDGLVGASTFAGYVGPEGFGLGYCGLNMVENYAWVNLNHASEYGLAGYIVAEPASLGLLGLGLLGLRRRRRS